jgi:hypothetical protein
VRVFVCVCVCMCVAWQTADGFARGVQNLLKFGQEANTKLKVGRRGPRICKPEDVVPHKHNYQQSSASVSLSI